MEKEKIKIYLDLDDTVFESSKTIIGMLNKKYNLNKTFEDLTDWAYRSIYPKMTAKMVNDIYDSDELFENLTTSKEFDKFYENNQDTCEFIFVSKGHQKNIKHKKEFLEKKYPGTTFIPLTFSDYGEEEFDKSSVDMNFGIQIDDRFDCLKTTNASVKILITHGKKVKWNYEKTSVDNLYKAKDWDEAIDVLNYMVNNPEIMLEKTWRDFYE